MDGDLTGRRRQLLALLLLDPPFHGGDEPVGLLALAVDELPAWALRHVPPHQQHPQAQDDAEGEAEPPADVLGEDAGVQHHDGQQGAADRAEPVAAVDDEVDPAPVVGRDQLVDRGVDRRVLAADAEAGQEAEEEEPPGLEGDRGQRGRRQIDHQRDHEQLLAAVPVGQPAEEQRPRAGTRHVERGGEAGDLGGADVQAAAALGDAPRDVADDRDFQAVQDPDGAQADDDHPVPARPGQPVQAGGDGGGDRPGGGGHRGRRVSCHGGGVPPPDGTTPRGFGRPCRSPARPGSRPPCR